MSELTKAESQWIKKVEKLLMNPPTDRLGLYTIGGKELSVYDRSKESIIEKIQDDDLAKTDFCVAVEDAKAELGTIKSAAHIHSTSG